MKGIRLLARAALLLAAAAPGLAQNVQIDGAGATFPFPIYSKWFSEYNKLHPEVQINYQSIGSGGGIRQLTNQTVFFGATDGPMTPEQMQAAAGKVLHLPTVLGGVVPIYNIPGVDAELKFTGPALADIIRGKITKWNDAAIAKSNPGVNLPGSDITVVHRSDGSGTTYIFVDYLSKVSEPFKKTVGVATSVNWPVGLGGKGNEGVAGLVRQTPGTIGYVELAYAKQNDFTVFQLKNKAGNFITPSLAATTAAASGAAAALAKDVRSPIVNSADPNAYPIAGLTYLLVYQDQKDATKAKALASFIEWCMSEGQAAAEGLDYAPLPPQVVQVNQANLTRLTAQGRPVVAKK